MKEKRVPVDDETIIHHHQPPHADLFSSLKHEELR